MKKPTIKRAVETVLASLGRSDLIVEARIMSGWRRIVGPQVASRSLPYRLQDGVLTVGVSNSVWLTQLGFLRQEMARKVNAHLGQQAVASVRLVLEKKSDWWPRGAPPAGPGRKAVTPEEERAIGEACTAIGDEELRAVVRRVLLRQAGLERRR